MLRNVEHGHLYRACYVSVAHGRFCIFYWAVHRRDSKQHEHLLSITHLFSTTNFLWTISKHVTTTGKSCNVINNRRWCVRAAARRELVGRRWRPTWLCAHLCVCVAHNRTKTNNAMWWCRAGSWRRTRLSASCGWWCVELLVYYLLICRRRV